MENSQYFSAQCLTLRCRRWESELTIQGQQPHLKKGVGLIGVVTFGAGTAIAPGRDGRSPVRGGECAGWSKAPVVARIGRGHPTSCTRPYMHQGLIERLPSILPVGAVDDFGLDVVDDDVLKGSLRVDPAVMTPLDHIAESIE